MTSIFVARVDGAILYPRDSDGVLNELGAEADKEGEAIDATIGQRPHIIIDIEAQAAVEGPVAGLARRSLYDYGGQPHRARYSQLLLAPGTEVPAHSTGGMTDFFVLAGEIRAGDEAAGSGCYVTIDAGAELTLTSRYGARVFAWADAPVRWLDGVERSDPYGW